MNKSDLADLLEAYGQFIREDWSDFDGRSFLMIMQRFADIYRREQAGEDVSESIQYEFDEISEFRELRGW